MSIAFYGVYRRVINCREIGTLFFGSLDSQIDRLIPAQSQNRHYAGGACEPSE